jgi:hypothetical protein
MCEGVMMSSETNDESETWHRNEYKMNNKKERRQSIETSKIGGGYANENKVTESRNAVAKHP